MTILDLLCEAARRHPDAPALLAPSRASLTYEGLRQQAVETAFGLRGVGIGAGDRVAVVLPNGPEMAAAAVAVASAAVCAPLNPAYGAEEFRFYLTDLQAKALLLPAGQDGPARTVAADLGIACLDVRWDEKEAAGRFRFAADESMSGDGGSRPPGTDDIALVLHTSGTTSRPKIVPLTHGNLCSSARNISRSLQLSAQDRCLNVMPLFHIHGIVAALFASLAAGGSVACTPGYRDGKFLPWLDEFDPTWTTAVPSMYQAILAELARAPAGSAAKRLRFARSSSAPLPPAVMRELEAALQAPVIEAYGMTEAAHQMASNPLPPATRKPGSVGVAAGPELAIMNEEGVLLPTGKTGEIVIRGDNVMHGYGSNPEANAKAFTAGWFRTGDQGFMDAEGYVFLTGRLKEIINRGGEKVSPREIDEALLEHPAVGQAVAFAMQHETLGEDIAAAVVLRPGAKETGEQIRAFLFGRLAEFKIPSQLVIVDAIPKGATGKVQRIGLEAKLKEQLKPVFVAPRDATEARVAGIFAEVLGSRELGAFCNFFSSGGDSLRGFQALARVRDQFQIDLSILDLFKAPTAALLAARIRSAPRQDAGDALERMLAEIEGISDEEAELQLQQLRAGPNATRH